jgi:hypothetical protein
MDYVECESLRIECPGNCGYVSKRGFDKGLIEFEASYAYCCWRCWQLHDRELKNTRPSPGHVLHGQNCDHTKYIPGWHGVHESIFDAYLGTEASPEPRDEEMCSTINAQSSDRVLVADVPPRGRMKDLLPRRVTINARVKIVSGMTPESEPETELVDVPDVGSKERSKNRRGDEDCLKNKPDKSRKPSTSRYRERSGRGEQEYSRDDRACPASNFPYLEGCRRVKLTGRAQEVSNNSNKRPGEERYNPPCRDAPVRRVSLRYCSGGRDEKRGDARCDGSDCRDDKGEDTSRDDEVRDDRRGEAPRDRGCVGVGRDAKRRVPPRVTGSGQRIVKLGEPLRREKPLEVTYRTVLRSAK